MDHSRIIASLQRAGFRGERLKTAYGIVMRESGGNPNAHNPNRATGDDSYGLAQINMLGAMGAARRKQFGIGSNTDLYDPDVNARAMYRMSRGGSDFGAWGIGPNAYRQGAGYDTIARYVRQFPGATAGERRPAARVPSTPQPPAAPNPQAVAALELVQQSITRRRGKPSPILAMALQRLTEQAEEDAPAPAAAPAKAGVDMQLPTSWRPTHVTDNLGWGTRSAEDIMGKPGTTLGAPEAGTVVYWHPTGAQGGGSMLFRADSGKEYWLGHVAHGRRAGTRVGRGQRLAVIANQHVSAPHVHIDERRV